MKKPAGRIERALRVRAGWWDRFLEYPAAWAAVAAVLCSLLAVPPAGPSLPKLSAGDVAPRDLVAPFDIQIPDVEATRKAQDRAASAVLPVYDYEPRIAEELVAAIKTVMSRCRENPNSLEKEAETQQLEIPEKAAALLKAKRCPENVEKVLIATVESLYNQMVVDDLKALERRGEGGVTIRNLQTGAEEVVQPSDFAGAVDFRYSLLPTIRSLLLEHNLPSRRWIKPLAELVAANIVPNVSFNRAETNSRRKKARSLVTERYQVFRKGQLLLRKGERVTPSVARALEELSSMKEPLVEQLNKAGIFLLIGLAVFSWLGVPKELFPGSEKKYRLSSVFILMIIWIVMERSGLFLARALAQSSQIAALAKVDTYLWALPHAAGTLSAVLLLGLEASFLFLVFQLVVLGVMLGGSFIVIPYSLAGGLAAIAAGKGIQHSSAMAKIGAMVGLAQLGTYWILKLYTGLEGGVKELLAGAALAFVSGPVSTALAGFLIPVLERALGVVTDLRLLELSDHSLPLLRRLAEEAPGTFQHSLAVAHLGEAAASAIGANALLLRVAAYYHDIGKLERPEYFVENQRGKNPHEGLAPSMSALILKGHVKDGLELARRHKLPLPIRQAIATHHGTKLMTYFYEKAKEEAEKKGTGPVNEVEFRYEGPKPHTKELGILLLADAVEAASRTLENPTRGKIQDMVQQIVDNALADGQLDSSELTLRDLDVISSTFVVVLSSRFHQRLDYPGFDFNRRMAKRAQSAARTQKKA